MTGIKIVIPTTFTGTGLPALRDDPILPDAGALILLEPAHVKGELEGVPNVGTAIPNIAAPQAAPLMGAGDATFTRDADFTGNVGTIERSDKGGIHGIVSQVNEKTNVGATIKLPDAFRTYLVDNADHSFYISMWSRVTRNPLTNIDFASKLGVSNSAGQRANFTHEQANANVHPPAHRLRRSQPRGPGGESFHGSTSSQFNDGVTPSLADTDYQTIAANWSQGIRNVGYRLQHSSWVFYRFYVEDLTISGRTAAQVDALDYAMFQAQVLAPGGRYYGDTFTDPATIP